jgi:hypothetical protein
VDKDIHLLVVVVVHIPNSDSHSHLHLFDLHTPPIQLGDMGNWAASLLQMMGAGIHRLHQEVDDEAVQTMKVNLVSDLTSYSD